MIAFLLLHFLHFLPFCLCDLSNPIIRLSAVLSRDAHGLNFNEGCDTMLRTVMGENGARNLKKISQHAVITNDIAGFRRALIQNGFFTREIKSAFENNPLLKDVSLELQEQKTISDLPSGRVSTKAKYFNNQPQLKMTYKWVLAIALAVSFTQELDGYMDAALLRLMDPETFDLMLPFRDIGYSIASATFGGFITNIAVDVAEMIIHHKGTPSTLVFLSGMLSSFLAARSQIASRSCRKSKWMLSDVELKPITYFTFLNCEIQMRISALQMFKTCRSLHRQMKTGEPCIQQAIFGMREQALEVAQLIYEPFEFTCEVFGHVIRMANPVKLINDARKFIQRKPSDRSADRCVSHQIEIDEF